MLRGQQIDFIHYGSLSVRVSRLTPGVIEPTIDSCIASMFRGTAKRIVASPQEREDSREKRPE